MSPSKPCPGTGGQDKQPGLWLWADGVRGMGEKEISSCFIPALNQVPAEMERREAEVAGPSNEQRTHPGRSGYQSPGSQLTPAPREAGGGVCVSPGAA